jgi:hypothetical protein
LGESEIVILQIDTNAFVGIGKCKLLSNLISIKARVTNNIAGEGVRGYNVLEVHSVCVQEMAKLVYC